jgi:hypothetical protein
MADTRKWDWGDASHIYTHPEGGRPSSGGLTAAMNSACSASGVRAVGEACEGKRNLGILAAHMVGSAEGLSSSRAMPIRHGPAGRRAVPDERA